MKKMIVLLSLISVNVFATPVNINSADAVTISKSLSGIGLKKADAIVADRVKNGPFKTADDLARVKGIGPKIVATNKMDILVEEPNAAKTATGTSTPAAVPVVPATPKDTKTAKPTPEVTDSKTPVTTKK